jgi:uncharacterized protein YaiL (DUF2058 family)
MKLKLNAVFTSILGFSLLLLPLLGNADIYKWKDKTGATRYADLPPEGNQKHETLGRKKVTKSGVTPPASEATKATTSAPAPANTQPSKVEVNDDDQEDAAKLRQKNADIEKKNKQEKEKQAKMNAENCKAAKSNLASMSQGGRVYKTNEKGEREYMDDNDLKQGVIDAQKDVDEYCN